MSAPPLLEVRDLRRVYRLRPALLGRRVRLAAVDGVSFAIPRGATLGVLGESGSGKSTLARLSLLLERPDGGDVRFDGRSLRALAPGPLRRLRPRVQIVFQDALGALDPRLPAGEAVGEALRVHESLAGAALRARVEAALAEVDLPPEIARRYPSELSGGQRQRIGLARALVLRPELLVLDEAVASLDVLLRARVLELLRERQAREGTAYLFIAHDAAAVAALSTEVAVMLAGRFVEQGPRHAVLEAPGHPYTRALLDAVLLPDPRAPWRRPAAREAEAERRAGRPSGCAFHPRCPLAEARCRVEEPALRTLADGRAVACHLAPLAPRLGAAPLGD